MTDLTKIPFSTYGSYLAISEMKKGMFKRFEQEDGLYIRSLHTYSNGSTLFKIDLMYDDQILGYTYEMKAEELKLTTDKGIVRVCFYGEKSIRFKGSCLKLKFTAVESNAIDRLQELGDKSWEFNSYLNGLKVRFDKIEGEVTGRYDWNGWFCENNSIIISSDNNQNFDVIMTEYESTSYPVEDEYTFAENSEERKKSFDLFSSPYIGLSVKRDVQNAIYKACYINWSTVVSSNYHMRRYGMLMSNNWMNKVWAWDHCFNALAHIKDNREFALDQFLLPFDHQHEDGSIPDVLSDGYISRAYYKLPVHGWFLYKLIPKGDKEECNLNLYRKISKWTKWWLEQRFDRTTGLCLYNHNNESGWDNSSVFASGEQIITPELNAFLIFQIEYLIEIAEKLSIKEDVDEWNNWYDSIMNGIHNHLILEDQLLPVKRDGYTPVKSDSLLPLEAIILGYRLPNDVIRNLVDSIEKHLGAYGLVSELLSSEYHEDHYWRGPVWAPPNYIIVDGLRELGEFKLAYKIVKNFVTNCIKNGFSENFSSLTGEGLCDGAYTWTSSVFLLFISEWRENLIDDGVI